MNSPIGIFDSGLGGLTIFRELRRLLPGEDLIYYGDTARVPYGGKSPETIIRYAYENTSFLMKHGIKALVIACNTASSYALTALDHQFSLPIIDVIQPAVKVASQITNTQHIAVIGTKATIRSEIYRKKIQEILPRAIVSQIACPLFVPLIEEDLIDHAATKLIAKEYLKALKDTTVDTLILGCTHYPFLLEIIQQEIEEKITILNSASACAERVYERLVQENLLSNKEKGNTTFYVSEDPLRFGEFAEKFLGTFAQVETELAPSFAG